MRFRPPHRPHLRPASMIRIGLFMYDHLGKRTSYPVPPVCGLAKDSVLKPEIVRDSNIPTVADDARLRWLTHRCGGA